VFDARPQPAISPYGTIATEVTVFDRQHVNGGICA